MDKLTDSRQGDVPMIPFSAGEIVTIILGIAILIRLARK
jgi:hypothetical protein